MAEEEVPLPEMYSMDDVIKDAAEALGVGVNTVRKYHMAIEKAAAKRLRVFAKQLRDRERWEFEVTGVVDP